MKNKNQFRVCLPSTYNENIVLYYVNAKNLLFYCHSWRLSLRGVMFWETKIFSSHKMILLFRRYPWSGGPVKRGVEEGSMYLVSNCPSSLNIFINYLTKFSPGSSGIWGREGGWRSMYILYSTSLSEFIVVLCQCNVF